MTRGLARRARAVGMLAALLPAMPGCRSGTISSTGAVVVRLRDDIVTVRSEASGVYATLPVEIYNTGQRTGYYQVSCGVQLQRQVDTVWTTLWSQICVDAGTPLALAPLQRASVDIPFAAYRTSTALPQADPRLVTGVYRILIQYGFELRDRTVVPYGEEAARASRPFTMSFP